MRTSVRRKSRHAADTHLIQALYTRRQPSVTAMKVRLRLAVVSELPTCQARQFSFKDGALAPEYNPPTLASVPSSVKWTKSIAGRAEAFLETQTPGLSPDSLMWGLGSYIFHIISNFCEWDPQKKTHFAVAARYSQTCV